MHPHASFTNGDGRTPIHQTSDMKHERTQSPTHTSTPFMEEKNTITTPTFEYTGIKETKKNKKTRTSTKELPNTGKTCGTHTAFREKKAHRQGQGPNQTQIRTKKTFANTFLMLGSSHSYHLALHCLADFLGKREATRAH